MKIAIDGYYAFHYKTGVAHYIRNLISSLATCFPDDEWLVFTDFKTSLYQPDFNNVRIIETGSKLSLYEWYDDALLKTKIEQSKANLFHATNHAIIKGLGVKQLVTIHDLFFINHPHLYKKHDVDFYREKVAAACHKANSIITISEFSKQQVLDHFKISNSKIHVCYQCCNDLFYQKATRSYKNALKETFNLPEKFWLYVGSITPRKNLMLICEAVELIVQNNKKCLPVVIIGEGDDYYEDVKKFIEQKNINHLFHFISYSEAAKNSERFQQARDVPGFYQLSYGLLYPSSLEGFGIPIVEALASGKPVITSNTSSLPEIGNNAAVYINHNSKAELAEKMILLENDSLLYDEIVRNGKQRLQLFSSHHFAECIYSAYRSLL